MAMIGWMLLFLAAALILAFNRASLVVWTISYAVLLVLVSAFSHVSVSGLFFLWLVFSILVISLNVFVLRRWLFSRHLLSFFRRKMPRLSATEREALTAGSVGGEGEIF